MRMCKLGFAQILQHAAQTNRITLANRHNRGTARKIRFDEIVLAMSISYDYETAKAIA